MDIQVFLGSVSIIYGILMLSDYLLKSYKIIPYLEFLQKSGISIGLFRLSFHTSKVNRKIVKWSLSLPSFYRNSFFLGSCFTLALCPVAIILIYCSILSKSPYVRENQIISSVAIEKPESAPIQLQVLLPGLNLPISEMGYYIASLLVCSVIHELGHGIAAVIDEVPVVGFGLQLMFIVPIAFTEIDTEHLHSVKMMKKMKIYSAGIWNNILLALLSYISLLVLPILLSPVYQTNQSVFVTRVMDTASVRGDNGLHAEDRVFQINGCPVMNEENWIECLNEAGKLHPAYCVSEHFVHDNEESIHEVEHQKDGTVSCCPENPSLNCFEAEAELPQYICLNIRNTIENSKDYCHKKKTCPHESFCVKPILTNTSTIIHMKRLDQEKDFVYYGHPYDVMKFVEVSGFSPKTKLFKPWIADAVALMLKYLTVFSSGLALVNVFPCYGLDGQFLVYALVSHLPSSLFDKKRKEMISNSIILVGTLTLFVAIIKLFYTMFLL